MDARITDNNSRRKARTYLPQAESQEEIIDIAKFFKDIEHFLGKKGLPSLTAPDGTVRELPQELFDVLEQVANALANGNGVTVAPYGMQLTTQEAADFLGVSRPTLVKLLTTGAIAHEMRGRHRRVTLRDLVDYQDRSRVARRETLRDIARDGQRSGISSVSVSDLQRLERDE